MREIEIAEWPTERALEEHLRGCGRRTLLLNEGESAPTRFCSATLQDLEVGVECYHGLAAVAARSESLAVVGHSCTVDVVDLATAAVVSTRRLWSPVFELMLLKSDDELIVVHEIGVIRLHLAGGPIWEVETDIVGSCVREGDHLLITQWQDDSTVVVELSSGRVLS